MALVRTPPVHDHVALAEIEWCGELMIAASATDGERLSPDRIDEVLDVRGDGRGDGRNDVRNDVRRDVRGDGRGEPRGEVLGVRDEVRTVRDEARPVRGEGCTAARHPQSSRGARRRETPGE
ncbi:hypothetical protein AB0O07_18650 [Streptomyces sp. NPDC093085]|uniref:hypothetical protein n=1 Tax=Streptomyces sp. NPDC093085 TaxID=3155068 RepID=UPI003426A2D8